MDTLLELSEDFLTCSICLENYKEPKQLPCLHSFCRGCLSDHINANDKGGLIAFPCPVCRSNTSPKSAFFEDPADDFPDNFYIASLMSSLTKKISGSSSKVETNILGDNCPNHPDSASDVFCVLSKVGVCGECQTFHCNCKDQHIPIHVAKMKAVSETAILKVKLASVLNHSKRLNESLVESPGNLHHRKEEILTDISKYFSDLRNKMAKHILDREKEMTTRLKDVVKEEEKWASEALDENMAITEACEKKLKFLDIQSTKMSLNAIGTLHAMDDMMKKFTSDLSRLETESDVQLLRYVTNPDLDGVMDTVSFGIIKSVHMDDELIENASEDLIKPDTSNPPNAQLHLPSAPPMLVPSAPPAYVKAFYGQQAYHAPQYQIPPTHGSFQGMVLNRPHDQAPTPKPSVEFNKVYLGQHYAARVEDSENVQKFIRTAKISCRLPSDTRQCKFVGITPVAEDVFVVVDRWNKNLKLMKLKGPIVKLLQIKHPNEPWDATRVLSSTGNQIAITCPSTRTILFVDYYDEHNQIGLKYNSQITTRVGYASLGGLTHAELVCGVCSPFGPPRIDIISLKGEILRRFTEGILYPRSIDTSLRHVIAISDWTKKHVLLLNEDGSTIALYKGSEDQRLQDPKGVAFYQEECFLIVDKDRLHKMTGEGKQKMVAKLTSSISVVACVPASSQFSKNGLVVVVGADDGCIHVYDGHCFQDTDI